NVGLFDQSIPVDLEVSLTRPPQLSSPQRAQRTQRCPRRSPCTPCSLWCKRKCRGRIKETRRNKQPGPGIAGPPNRPKREPLVFDEKSQRALRIGVAGPVGSGKTALVHCLSRELAGRYDLAVVTNDIYTREDAEFLLHQGVLSQERV